MKYLLYIILSFAFLNAANIKRDSRLEVVVDYDTQLMWVDNIDVSSLMMSHKEAEPYCKTLRYAGYSNWRLPDIKEFQTIVDKKNEVNYILRVFKFNVPTGYWASKAHFRTFWFYADYMNFVSGTPYYDNRNINKYVRCVRDLN